MLVLSRRQKEQLVFPTLGIRVHVVRINGKTVRLGVEAPRDVPVLREEISDKPDPRGVSDDAETDSAQRQFRHALRNRLNTSMLGLQLLQRQIELGELDDPDSWIQKIFNELEMVEESIAGSRVQNQHNDSPHDSTRGDLRSDGLVPQGQPRRRALLVEDDANESSLLADFLRTCNFRVDTAFDGADALQRLAAGERPDVVLLDMNMPRMDGCRTIQEIRSNPANAGLKVFVLSGMDRDHVQAKAALQRIDGWFSKPIRPRELVRALRRELDEAVIA